MRRWLILVLAAVCGVRAGEERGDREFLEGRYLDALASYRAELRAAADGRERARVLGNLALLYVQLGEYDLALASYRELLGSAELTGAARGRALGGLGDLYRRMGQAGQALEAYGEARKAFEEAGSRADEIRVLQSAGAAGGGERAFAEAVRLAEAGGDRAEAVRAHLFLGEERLRAGEVAGAEHEFAAARGGGRDTEWRAIFGAARVERGRGERDRALALARQAVAALDAATAGAGESDFLPDARAVYDAAMGMLLEGTERDPAEWFGLMERAHAAGLRDLVRGEGPPTLDAVRRRLAAGAGLVEYWAGGPVAVWATREGAGVGSGAEIPWEKMRRVWIVPDGAMWRTAFEAEADGSGRRLIERAAVSYLPVAALLFREREARGALAPWRTRMAAFGGGAGARGIAQVLPGRVAVYGRGAEMKEGLAESAAAGVAVLDFAVPAVAEADGNRSRIVFGPGSAGWTSLFRGEILRLPLGGADLVTLAVVEGDGRSLSEAFLAAGARAVVAPLWDTGDGARADFLREFYANVGRGMAPADALRAVKLAWLRGGGTRADAKMWAAFVLMGNGEERVREVTPWWTVVVVVLLLAGGAGVWWWRR